MDTVIIERAFGLIYLVFGLSLLINPGMWYNFIHEVTQNQRVLSFTLLALVIGSVMVAGHNIWESSPRIGTTIMGWLVFITATTLILSPKSVLILVKRFAPNKNFLQKEGMVVIVIATYLLISSY